MDTNQMYKLKYLKYKNKYINLKYNNIKNLIGGNNNSNINLENLIRLRNKMELLLNDLKKSEPELLSNDIYFWGKNPIAIKLGYVINEFIDYLKNNDIPLNYYNLSLDDINIFIQSIDKLKNELTEQNLIKLYKLREYIYTLNEENMNEILDSIIVEFNINNEKDIEKIFTSSILGFNKNYIINYMVLFRYLLKNHKQLSIIENNIND